MEQKKQRHQQTVPADFPSRSKVPRTEAIMDPRTYRLHVDTTLSVVYVVGTELRVDLHSMATFRIGQLSEYKEGQEDFESYLERLEQWMIANEVDEGKKVSVFLSVIGAEAYRLLKNLTMPAKPSSLTYKELNEKLSAYYKPKPLVIAERFRFQKRNQLENETVSEYMVALKQLSTHCDFGNHLDEALRDRFVSGLKAEAIQRKLLAERALTFKSACEIALSMEMAARNILEFAGKVKESGTVHKIASTKGNKSPGKKKTNVEYQKTSQTGFKTHQTCYRCGGSHAAHVCRSKNEKCHHCSKVGHIARACREKKKVRTDTVCGRRKNS
ncbi:hypothetical protein NFI96_011262 [Prochilodus magdalenae]|nr:hypothetical protein NFI96_011262 [Prochilodus magdalenae]